MNITNIQETQPPVVRPQNSPSHKSIYYVVGSILLIGSLVFLGYQNWQLRQQVNRLDKLIQVDDTPSNLSSPAPSPDPTANWKTYSFNGGLFKYPPSWSENPVLIRGSGFTQEIKDKEGLYMLTLFTQGNYSQITGNPYATLEEFIGPPPNILETLTIDGQQGGQVLPRAGSENKNAVIFFSKDKKVIYTIELDTGSSTLTDPRVTEESVKTGQELFDQILSTFKFFDKGSSIPVSTTNLKKLTYYLPTGWRTVQDKTGSFEIGYDPSISKVSEPIEENTVSIYRTDRILGSFITVRLLPYSGESRHQFLYAQIGEKPVKEDLLPTYHELEYSYNGKSCLFLVGIAISQYPTTWGMCDAGNKKAFLVTSYDDNVYEKFVQTIRLMK